jgi:uncharacterized protein YbjT (DUF2867 family)
MIFVTGATGNVGSEVVRALLQAASRSERSFAALTPRPCCRRASRASSVI